LFSAAAKNRKFDDGAPLLRNGGTVEERRSVITGDTLTGDNRRYLNR